MTHHRSSSSHLKANSAGGGINSTYRIALAVCAALGAAQGARAQNAAADQPVALEEIVVTATRRAERIQDVPISIAAFSQAQMDQQGVKSVDDIARLTPGVSFSRGGGGFGSDLSSQISIRGVASTAGSATTGVYIDDTPIQVGSVIASGNFANNAYPQLFDVERVEVLRGPQGTLFGSGSEGGTVRFVTPGPNMHNASVYVRSEASYTQYGAPSYEAGVAGGAPIIDGVLGFRASAWHRRDGGFIDKVSWYTGQLKEQNANWNESSSARLALGWVPVDGLTITPSVFFQHIKANEAGAFYLHDDAQPKDQYIFKNSLGDVANGNYVDLHNQHQWADQRLVLPALKVDYQFANMELLSNTSYYDRSQSGVTDFQSLEAGFWAHMIFPPNENQLTPGFDKQADHYFTQEVRLQSTDKDARFKWLVGAYYSRDISNANRAVSDPYLGQLMSIGFGCPAAFCVEGVFGVPQTTEFSFVGNTQLVEKQKAVFAQGDYKITDHFIATVGLRYSKLNNDWQNYAFGPVNGQVDPIIIRGTSSATATTPKYMLSYKLEDALIYASATKGFRNGGVNAPIAKNKACNEALADLGTDAKPTYNPDHVWSYELGSKFALDQGRVQVDASIFQIDWKDQIRNVNLVACTLAFTDNLGAARARGADLSVQWRALDPWTVGLAAGYQYVQAMEDLQTKSSGFLARNGQKLPGTQPSVTLTSNYNFTVWERPSYFHVDYTYTGIESGTTSTGTTTDSRVVGYTAAAAEFTTPAIKVANVRLGTNLGDWDVSVFANNLFNSQPLIKQRGTTDFDAKRSGEITATTIRPRTIGVTGIYRF